MKKNGKITLAVLTAGTILSLAVRIYVIVAHTDMTTGFLYHGEELLCNILYYGIIAAAAVTAIFTARVDEKNGVGERTASDIGSAGVAMIGFLTLIAGLFAAYEGMKEIKAITPTKFLIAVDFLFALVLIIIAFATLYKKKFTPGLGYSYSLIGAYCTCRGIYCFMSRMAIVTVPEYLIECLSLIGMSVFFVLLGRFLSGNETKHTRKAACFWGVGTAVITLSSALGTLIARAVAPEEIRVRIVFTSYDAESFRQASAGVDAYKMVATPWVNLFLGALIVAALVTMFLRSAPKSEDTQTVEANTEDMG